MNKILTAVLCLLAFIFFPILIPPDAVSAPASRPPDVSFGDSFDNDTPPLAKAIKEKVEKRRDKEKKEKKVHPQCLAALNMDPPDEERIQKFCTKSPGHEKQLLRKQDITTEDGKRRGRKIKTKSVIKYDSPGQRYGHEKRKWDKVVIKPPKTGDMTARGFGGTGNSKDKGRNKWLLSDGLQAINDDQDCIDSITGEHLREDACFDEDGNLWQTLTPTEGGCVHENGLFLEGVSPPVDEDGDGQPDENACYFADGQLKTSLDELVDEDGPSPDRDGDGVYFDIDGDGTDGEDPPETGEYPVNNDRDCVDMVTSKHWGGAIIADGAPESCFDTSGTLKQTLVVAFYGCETADGTFVAEEDCYDGDVILPGLTPIPSGCRHTESDTFLEGDPDDGLEDACYDASGVLKTTLAELINEDDGLPVDDDNDGMTDEDGPESTETFAESCRRVGHEAGLTDTSDMITDDGGCDLTRVVVRRANRKAQENGAGKPYKADDQGYVDPALEGEDLYGEEPRQVTIVEDITILCESGMVLDEETGQCIPDEQVAALEQYRANAAPITNATAMNTYAMMGFTFAPPRVRWGIFYKEELDLFFFTITLFEVKAGYDFGLGLGFRLPSEVAVLNLPGASILAEQDLSLFTEIQPVNFEAQDYRDFCAVNQMGNTAYCNRFAFPNALVPSDGDELAIRLTAFAGLKVVIVEIPIVNWGIDIDADLPEWCSLYLAYNEEPDTLAIEIARQVALGMDHPFGRALSELDLNCGTYTTPFGLDHDDVPRQFPFIQNAPFVNQMIRADCAEAFVRGETIKLPDGEIYPLCTGLILGVPGASLGLGLGVDLEVSSNRIDATVTTSGDAALNPSSPYDPTLNRQEISYSHSADEGEPPVPINAVRADNFDGGDFQDNAIVNIGDFTYCLNQFSIRLKGQVMFGGILTIFPDFDDFTIYRFTLPGVGCGIPIGQHAGTQGVSVPVFVENYGLDVTIEPLTLDPELRVDDRTLKVEPGQFGEFLVGVRNIGSMPGEFDNFTYALSNLKDQSEPYSFVINPNTDMDCRDSQDTVLRDDQCFGSDGQLFPGLVELINEDDFGPAGALREIRDEDDDGWADEDPPDVWETTPDAAGFNSLGIFQVEPYAYSVEPPSAAGESLILAISPFRHPLTRPGLYPFRIMADSSDARVLGLAPVDPSGHHRMGASAVAFIEVVSFREPRIAISPESAALRPGVEQNYMVEATNMGNLEDSISMTPAFLDFNIAGCTLTTMGSEAGCPYRAVPTQLDAAGWTTVNELATQFGPLEPLESGVDSFRITVPSDWAGMTDTTYQYSITVISLEDEDEPPASNMLTVDHTVLATKESMTRYIRLEIQALIAEIRSANSQGIRTGGLLPISMRPALRKINQALTLVLQGKMQRASNALSSNRRIMRAFIRALNGFNGKGTKIPAAMDEDWRNRALAIIDDLAVAAENQTPSAGAATRRAAVTARSSAKR